MNDAPPIRITAPEHVEFENTEDNDEADWEVKNDRVEGGEEGYPMKLLLCPFVSFQSHIGRCR